MRLQDLIPLYHLLLALLAAAQMNKPSLRGLENLNASITWELETVNLDRPVGTIILEIGLHQGQIVSSVQLVYLSVRYVQFYMYLIWSFNFYISSVRAWKNPITVFAWLNNNFSFIGKWVTIYHIQIYAKCPTIIMQLSNQKVYLNVFLMWGGSAVINRYYFQYGLFLAEPSCHKG